MDTHFELESGSQLKASRRCATEDLIDRVFTEYGIKRTVVDTFQP